MKISVILLIKNGVKFLPKLLEKLGAQKGVLPFELVVVDSGSTDGGMEYVKSIKVSKYQGIKEIKCFQIKSEDFGHGKTRNFAVAKTTGEIVVFMSQDALPINNDWLFNLIKPFSDPVVAGVFGQQVPNHETGVLEKYFYSHSYTLTRRVMTENDSKSFSSKNLFFSNVNGAVRRELLVKFPFREDLLMSEDQYWGRAVLEKGYQLVYEPDARVFHSHNYNLKRLFVRYFQSGYSQRQINLNGNVIKRGIGTGVGLLKYILINKPLLLPYTLIYEFIKGGAFVLGRKGGLPSWIEKRLIK